MLGSLYPPDPGPAHWNALSLRHYFLSFPNDAYLYFYLVGK